MADSNHLSARADEHTDDDPFAELTRIMGQGSFVRPQPVDDMEALGLDLEKELLGDFSDDQGTPSGLLEEPQPEFDVTDAFGEEDFASNLFKGTGLDDFEQALSTEPGFEDPEPAQSEDADQPYIPDEHHQVDAYDARYAADLTNELDGALEQSGPPSSSIFSEYGEPEASYPEPETAAFEADAPGYDPDYQPNSAFYDQPSDTAEPQQYAASDAPFDLTGAIFSLRGNYAPAEDHYAEPVDPSDQFAQEDFSLPLEETDLQFDNSDFAADGEGADSNADLTTENFAPAQKDADADPFAANDLAIKDELERALGLAGGWDVSEQEPSFAAEETDAPQSYDETETQWQAAGDETDWADDRQSGNLGAAAGVAAAAAWTGWKASDRNDNWQQQAADRPAEQEPAAQAYDSGYASYAQADQSWADDASQAEAFEPTAGAAAYDGPPEIETVDIPEKAVAVTDNLDIPHVPYREEVKSTAQLDDIEELLSGAFGSLDQPAQADEWAEQEEPQEQQSAPTQDDFDELLTAGLAAASAAALARNNYSPAEPQFEQGWNEAYEQTPGPMPGTPPPAATSGGFLSRRNKTIAALLAGVAILGIGSVFAYNQFGGGGSGEAVIIKADNTPIKEKPENPGGTTVPNQDSQVYRQVAGETAEPGSGQTQLVSSAEEPVELPTPADDVEEVLAQQDELLPQEVALSESMAADTAAKNEERLVSTGEEAGQSESFTMLTPRRVRSYVVRPDGTMVPREVEAPAAAAASEPLPGVNSDRIEVAAAGATNASQDAGLVAGQEVPPLGAAPAGLEQAQPTAGTMPQSAPIPAPRPANVARSSTAPTAQSVPSAPASTAPTQVAAVQPAAPAASTAASGWSVQIASQPTLEAAQQSYQSLAQRYGTMLQGKGVNIVKAEVQGKGTYYRVRIPASSKNDAISLCESLKTQGGSCFVSQ